MNNTITFFPNFIARIFLRKKILFGLKSVELSLLVTPSLKIIKIINPNKIDFIYKENDLLNVCDFSKWISDNDFDFSFSTKSKTLKRLLILDVGLVVDKLNQNKPTTWIEKVFKWFKT